ncbi:C subunit of V-ATPase [Sarcoptes scabiei]|nr:C subunit of V-ATPase [Sarcoptes scabiei]
MVRLKDHDSIDELAIELMHKINQRNQYPTNTSAYAKSDLYIKELFRKLQKLIYCLQIDLKALSDSNKLTQRERDRRQRMINSLQDRSKNIEIKLQNPLISKRNDLFKKSEKEYPNERTPYSINSNEEEESKQSVSGLREAQRVMIDEQERNLDTLTEIVQRQKSLALGIDAEITVQNGNMDFDLCKEFMSN